VSSDGRAIIHEQTGTPLVEPGHPIVLAAVIMTCFPSLKAASSVDSDGYAHAANDSRIPGQVCHIGAALRILRQGCAGAGIESMVKEADLYWSIGQAGGNLKNVEPGREQARQMMALFREKAQTWFRKSAEPAR
jgi:hypothetical protein